MHINNLRNSILAPARMDLKNSGNSLLLNSEK